MGGHGRNSLFILPVPITIASAIMTSDCEVQERKLRGAETAVISEGSIVLAMSATRVAVRCDTQFGHHLQRSLPLLLLR
jgi:hypothetical protein